MSGSFEDIDVPPTLVSFAVTTDKVDNIISPEFKNAGSKVVILKPEYDENGLPVFESVRNTFAYVEKMIDEDTEMVSIYFGSESSEDDASVIAEAIEEKYPDVDVEINDGGQPIYYYVISVE